MIDDRMYDMLKTIALMVAPFTVLVSSLLGTWGVPYTEQITATLAAIDVFVGAVVAILKAKYDNDDDDGMVG